MPVARAKAGPVRIPIFKTSFRSKGKLYTYHEVRWTDASGRKHRVKRRTLAEARKLAEATADSLHQGHRGHAAFHPSDLTGLEQSTAALSDTSIELQDAARMVARWFSVVTAKLDHTPTSAQFDDFVFRALERAPGVRSRVPISAVDALPLFLADKRRLRNASARHLEDLKSRLGAIVRAFPGPLSDWSADAVAAWLARLSVPGPEGESVPASNRTHNNYLGALQNFAAWSHRQRFIDAAALNEFRALQPLALPVAPTEIYTPAQLAALMAGANGEFAVCLALQAFAGLRSAEVCRLEWSHVRPARRVIEVTAGNAKTSMRRLAPLLPALKAFLPRTVPTTGRVWRHSRAYFHELQRDTAAAAGIPWKRNALRHSFISYRLAVLKDVAALSLESGNGARIIHSNYRELVTPSDARRWFAVRPTKPASNVVKATFLPVRTSKTVPNQSQTRSV